MEPSPDLFAFTIPFILAIFSGAIWGGHRPHFPSYIGNLYAISHSLIIFLLVIGIIYLFKKKFYIWMIGWPLHIVLDIFTHSKEFYPTPFLYPLSKFTIDGIQWSNGYVFFTNWALLLIVYAYLFRKEIKVFFKKLF